MKELELALLAQLTKLTDIIQALAKLDDPNLVVAPTPFDDRISARAPISGGDVTRQMITPPELPPCQMINHPELPPCQMINHPESNVTETLPVIKLPNLPLHFKPCDTSADIIQYNSISGVKNTDPGRSGLFQTFPIGSFVVERPDDGIPKGDVFDKKQLSPWVSPEQDTVECDNTKTEQMLSNKLIALYHKEIQDARLKKFQKAEVSDSFNSFIIDSILKRVSDEFEKLEESLIPADDGNSDVDLYPIRVRMLRDYCINYNTTIRKSEVIQNIKHYVIGLASKVTDADRVHLLHNIKQNLTQASDLNMELSDLNRFIFFFQDILKIE